MPAPISILSKTYQMWTLLLLFNREQDSGKKKLASNFLHGNPIFDAMFTDILTFDLISTN